MWLTLVPLGVLGIWETRRLWRRQVFLYVYAAMFALSIIAVFIVGRYRLEELLPVLVWAGAGVGALARCAWETRWSGLGIRTSAVVGGIALLWPAWSPAVAYNAPKKMPGIHLVRPNDYNRLALAHLEIKQRQQARALLEEAVAQYPYIDGLVFPLETIYIEDREPQKALTILQGLLRSKGPDKAALLRLADALSLCGRKSDAVELAQGLLRKYPDDAVVKAMLARVQSRE